MVKKLLNLFLNVLLMVAQMIVIYIGDMLDAMKKNISDVLNLDLNQVNIKATTEEGLGFTGNKEGISAFCVALIY